MSTNENEAADKDNEKTEKNNQQDARWVDKYWQKYWQLLGNVGKMFVFFTVITALLSTVIYFLSTKNIEQINNRDLSPGWTLLLLWIPIVIQVWVFWRLREQINKALRENEEKREENLEDFFKFYFRRMAGSLLAYTSLWCIYVFPVLRNGLWSAWIVSWLPPILILALICIIIHATYVVVTGPFSKAEATTQRLQQNSRENQRDGMTSFPFFSLVFFFSIFLCIAYLFGFAFAFEDKYVQLSGRPGQVALLMSDELNEDTSRQDGSLSFRISDLKKPAALVTKLRDSENKISKYLTSQFSAKTNTLLSSYNDNGAPSEELQSALVSDFNKLLKSGNPLFDEQYVKEVNLSDRTEKLKAQSPQGTELIRLNRLFLENAFPEEIAEMQSPYPANYSAAYIKRVRKTFYFSSRVAGVKVNEGSYLDPNDKYISKVNNEHFKDLLSKITDTLDVGKTAHIVLVGRADDGGLANDSHQPARRAGYSPAKNTYASNLDLAGTRIKTIRFELQRLLLENKISPSQMQAIDWIELPVSNDEALPLRALAEDQAGDQPFNDDVVRDETVKQPAMTNDQKAQKISQADLCLQTSEKDSRAEFGDYCTRLQKLTDKLEFSKLTNIYNHLQEWKKLEETKGQDKGVAERKKDTIEEELYRLEDPDGSKRLVEVFFYEAHDMEPFHNSFSKRMALMDYLYFAIYTITTTGYGDIKPITPYAKFLCTLANITEFFFIVVFFNTLLSLKRARES
jgi:hypothetical protein